MGYRGVVVVVVVSHGVDVGAVGVDDDGGG